MNKTKDRLERYGAESGVLRCDGVEVSYVSGRYGEFSILVSELVAIGEYTTDHGPFLDDWFLVFVVRGNVGWVEASMYAAGSMEARERLADVLGFLIASGLAAETNFASHILWPAELVGQPLFDVIPLARAGILGRVKAALLPKVERRLTAAVLQLVAP
jgi:hypothetical protein